MLHLVKRLFREKNFLSLFNSVAGAALGLISFMILTRTFDKAEFGSWVIYTALATLFNKIRTGLVNNGTVRFASGVSDHELKSYLGAGYGIGLVLVGIIAVLFWSLSFLLSGLKIDIGQGYQLFFKWYPLLAIANLNWNSATSSFLARQKFMSLLGLRLFNLGIFVIFLIFNYFFFDLPLEMIIVVQLIVNFIPSIYTAVRKIDGMHYIRRPLEEKRKELLKFGSYSLGTLLGSNLLKSADSIIIGMSAVMGPTAVALYAIPLKLTDLLGIPLLSFNRTAFPRMSEQSRKGNMDAVRSLFYVYSGAITYIFILGAAVCFFLAPQLVLILGGSEYIDSLGQLVILFRIFIIYIVLLPMDRFSGVALDSINLPNINFYKVLVMASANIIGDIIAVFVFESLYAVAIVTILFTILGIGIGWHFLNKNLNIQMHRIFTDGWLFFKNFKQYFSKGKK